MNKLFLVRVELHNAIERDYQVLHTAMAKLGFNRYLVSSSGTKYELPTAEYISWSNSNVTAIKALVRTAANSTGKTSWLLVAETAQLDWDLRIIQ